MRSEIFDNGGIHRDEIFDDGGACRGVAVSALRHPHVMDSGFPPCVAEHFTTSDGVATVAELRALGFSAADIRGAVASHRLVRHTQFVVASPTHRTDRTLARLAVTRSKKAALSHGTVPALWDPAVFAHPTPDEWPLEPPHVTLEYGGRAPPWCKPHWTERAATDIGLEAGMRATTPVRTLCDLGAETSPTVVERALEYAIRTGRADAGTVSRRADDLATQGRSGPAVIQQILRRRGVDVPVTESDAEFAFLIAVRHPDLPDPIRQRPFRAPNGTTYRVDFAYEWPWLSHPVWVEIDGVSTHEGRDALIRDLKRQNALMQCHPILLRYTPADVYTRPRGTRDEVWHHLGIRARR